MKKKLLIIGGSFAALALIGFLCLALFLGSIVTAGVNRFGPQITQTKVELASASISPLSGRGTLSGLVVGNPKGWSDKPLCTLGKVHLDVAPFSILGDHIVINEILIEAPEFNYETKIIASNVNDLLKNIEQLTGTAEKTGTAPTAKNGKPIKFEVKHFRLSGGKVRLGVGGLGAALPMLPIELNDLGTKEGGISPDQLVFAVMKNITGSIVSATVKGATQLGGTAGAAASEGVKKTGEAIKGIFGGGKK